MYFQIIMTETWFKLLVLFAFIGVLSSCNKNKEETELGPYNYDLLSPYSWRLSSTPLRYPESKLVNEKEYGFNRAHLAWFNIDRDLVRKGYQTPSYFTVDDFSNHNVREIGVNEVFDIEYHPNYFLQIMNLYFNPNEKGAYNYDTYKSSYSGGINSAVLLNNPASRWGGMQCETNDMMSYDSIVLWLMDPFIYDNEIEGDLYINIGEISEDVLKDNCLSYEKSQKSKFESHTVWGRVLREPDSLDYSETYPFPDYGLDGLLSYEEKTYYDWYLNEIRLITGDNEMYVKIAADPSNDDFKHFLDQDYDLSHAGIIERYSRFNNMELNSQSSHTFPSSSYSTSDNEDLNENHVLDTANNYYEYHIKISKSDFSKGLNFIDSVRQTLVKLANGKQEYVKWFKICIPQNGYESIHGNITKGIRPSSIRVYLTNFNEPVNLRFAEFGLIK